MFEFNVMFIFSVYLFLSTVFECKSAPLELQCQKKLLVPNGQARLLISGGVTIAKITCFQPYVLVNGNETMTCVEGKWDSEFPICAKYDPIHLPCDFESPDERFCGWRNYMYNEIEWLADRISVVPNSNKRHVTPGSSQYFTNYYISLDAGDYGSTTVGQLLSPSLLPVATKQRCLQFSYKVTSGNSQSRPTLKVIIGGIPHWETHEGEGRAIIGLYRFNVSYKIVIEGSSGKIAIDNLIVTEDNSCTQRLYDEEIDSCHDNCGKISDGVDCSCDWKCHNNNNCCPDIQFKCPFIKPMNDIARLYLAATTTAIPTTMMTSEKNNILNLSCDFESTVETFCGWKNDIFNNADWLADKITMILFNSGRHVTPGSSNYFSSNYISLNARNNGSTTIGRLLSPPLLPVISNQRCLIFAYKVTGNSNSSPILKVTFGGIPHWETHEGEGRAIVGLYKFNITSRIAIEGKNCKAAIDNIVITEGKSCNKRPYVEEIDSCHDNCGKISDGVDCSCDWNCHNNNNCCPDIQFKCPYIKPMDDIARLYLATTTTTISTTMTTSEKNKKLNVTIPKNGHNDTITIDKLYLTSTEKLLNITHFLKNTSFFDPLVKILHKTTSNSADIGLITNTTLNGLISRRSPNIDNFLNLSNFSDKNLTDILQPNSKNSVLPLKHNQTLTTDPILLNNHSGLPVVIAESTNLLENLTKNTNGILSYVYNGIYIIGYIAAVAVLLFICKYSFYFIKSFIKKPTYAKDQTFDETRNEVL